MLANLDRDALVLEMEGAECTWALRRRVLVPLRCVRWVSTELPRRSLFSGTRARGTMLPPLLCAGTYYLRTRHGLRKVFAFVRRPDACVTIRLSDHEFDLVMFDADDKVATAMSISESAGIELSHPADMHARTRARKLAVL